MRLLEQANLLTALLGKDARCPCVPRRKSPPAHSAWVGCTAARSLQHVVVMQSHSTAGKQGT